MVLPLGAKGRGMAFPPGGANEAVPAVEDGVPGMEVGPRIWAPQALEGLLGSRKEGSMSLGRPFL